MNLKLNKIASSVACLLVHIIFLESNFHCHFNTSNNGQNVFTDLKYFWYFSALLILRLQGLRITGQSGTHSSSDIYFNCLESVVRCACAHQRVPIETPELMAMIMPPETIHNMIESIRRTLVTAIIPKSQCLIESIRCFHDSFRYKFDGMLYLFRHTL